jgi:hypothetical protein
MRFEEASGGWKCGRLAIFHGPRRIARYGANGQPEKPELKVAV